jgi:hypothetical protein
MQPVTVVLDLMNPVVPGRRLDGTVGMRGATNATGRARRGSICRLSVLPKTAATVATPILEEIRSEPPTPSVAAAQTLLAED